MPVSSVQGKSEVIEFIKGNYPSDTSIIDIGAGCGWWGKALKELEYMNVDAIEIHHPYISQFELSKKYRDVFLMDIRKWDVSSKYKLAIMGDVLEHLSEEDAILILDKLNAKGIDVIVAVPWMSIQGAAGGVESEIHVQDTLTAKSVSSTYSPDLWLYISDKRGYFVRYNIDGEAQKNINNVDYSFSLSRYKFFKNKITFNLNSNKPWYFGIEGKCWWGMNEEQFLENVKNPLFMLKTEIVKADDFDCI